MTNEYYLRIEGVNLANFVYDTQDLNVARGGGLLLLNAIDMIQKKFKLKPISTGASSGLFSFEVENQAAAEQKAMDIQENIRKDANLKHATFVVDLLLLCEDFAVNKERLIAMNRWQQMQAPSMAVPGSPGSDICYVDMVRPATHQVSKYKGKEDVPLSESAYCRREYGINQKKRFYGELTGLTNLPEFVYDLDTLTNDAKKGSLHHKMAVIYVDGNDFGKIQAGCRTPKKLTEWDDTLKGYRKQLLATLFKDSIGSPEWTTDEGLHRMETLLWGGDELIWVVPAWCGWWTINFFYSQSTTWEFYKTPLKHSTGVVFCHHNAPISRVTELARALAELAKEKSRKDNLVAYQLLESFDHLGLDPEGYRRSRCPSGVDPEDLIISGDDIGASFEPMGRLKANFPKRKLYKIARSMFYDPDKTDSLIEDAAKDMDEETLQQLSDSFGAGKALWLHISDLWDYLG